MLSGTAQAAALTWDISTVTAGPQDGAGTWDTSTTKWWNGTADVRWTTTTDTAVFGGLSGAAGSVTVAAAGIGVDAILFRPVASGTYTLAGTGLITLGAGGINATTTANISAPVTLGAAQSWITASSKTLTISGAVTNGASTLTVDGAGTTAISGIIGGGSGGLTKSGTGTLTLKGANSYTGVTNVDGGTLNFATTNGKILNTSAVNVNSGGTIEFSLGGNAGFDPFSSIGRVITINSGGTMRVLSDYAAGDSAEPTVHINGGTLELASTQSFYSVVISGAGSQVTGAGKLLLAGYGGGAPNTLQTTAAASGSTISAGIDFFNNALSNNDAPYYIEVADGTAENDLTISGTITSDTSSALSWQKTGAGTLLLSGANTLTASTRIVQGTLVLGNSAALQNSTLDMKTGDAGTVSFGVLTDATLGGLSGSRNISLENAAAVALSVGGNNATSTYSGVLSGTGSLVKTGYGTQTLTGSNSYTGATTVKDGTLEIAGGGGINASAGIEVTESGTLAYNGSAPLTAPLTLTSGTLKGNGVVANSSALTIGAGVIVAPGNSTGMLTTGSQVWDGGGAYQWELEKVIGTGSQDGTGLKGVMPGFDFLTIVGELTVNATALNKFVIDITGDSAMAGWDAAAAYSWTIVTADSIQNFNRAAFLIQIDPVFAERNKISADASSFGISQSGNSIVLNYYVPEPGTLGLLALGALALLGRRRSRA